MSLVDFALEKRVVTWTLTAVALVAGMKTFGNLNRLEDPEFTIKNAQIVTPYPGASPEEVEAGGQRPDRTGHPGAGSTPQGRVLVAKGGLDRPGQHQG